KAGAAYLKKIVVQSNWCSVSELKDTAFYLTGRAASINVMRKVLIDLGVKSKWIQMYPYWSVRKPGL
ncbi:MAG: hypothetical protein AAF840_00510, partial [Bacteroidota bacterium]